MCANGHISRREYRVNAAGRYLADWINYGVIRFIPNAATAVTVRSSYGIESSNNTALFNTILNRYNTNSNNKHASIVNIRTRLYENYVNSNKISEGYLNAYYARWSAHGLFLDVAESDITSHTISNLSMRVFTNYDDALAFAKFQF